VVNPEAKPEARAIAMGGAVQFYDSSVKAALIAALADPHQQLRRLAAETLSRNVPATDLSRELFVPLMLQLEDRSAAVQRSAALALGELAGQLPAGNSLKQEVATAIAETLKTIDNSDVYLFDGVLRGLERLDHDGINHLVNWLGSSEESLRERAVFCIQSFRTKAGEETLDRLLDEDSRERLSAAQQSKVIATYRDIMIDSAV